MKKLFVILALLLLAVIFAAGCIQNAETPNTPLPPENPETPVIPKTPVAPPPPAFKSVDEYVSLLNELYNLGLTEEEIQSYAEELDTGYLKDATRAEGGIWIDDKIEFQNEVTRVMNLDQAVHDDIINRIENPDAYRPTPKPEDIAPETPKPTQPGVPALPTTIISDVEEFVRNLAEKNEISVTDAQVYAVAEELKNGCLKDKYNSGMYGYEVTDYPGFKEETLRILKTL